MGSETLKVVTDTQTPEQILAEVDRTRAELQSGVVYRPLTQDKARDQYQRSWDLRDNMNLHQIPFIMPECFPDFYLIQGITLVCGMTGKGKSTAAANVLNGYLQSLKDPTRKAAVITNEESVASILDRVSCIQLGYNYMDLHLNKMDARRKDAVKKTSEKLLQHVEIINDEDYDMACMEHVKAVLEYAAKTNIGIVIVDYLQTVTYSSQNEDMTPYQISKKLGLYFKDYGREHGVPIIVFAQINPPTRNQEPIQYRVQGDKTIGNHAFNIIEIIPDFDTGLTEFKMHKNRFGFSSGTSATLKYVKGRYEAPGL